MKQLRLLTFLLMLWGFGAVNHAQQSIFDASWGAEYYNNPYLAGMPAFVRQDRAVGFDWSFDSPGEGVPVDNFSVRWGKGGYLAAGTYRFIITADESFRLYVDDVPLIDVWDDNVAGSTHGAEIFLEAGVHRLQIDYREFAQSAYIYLDWGLVPGGEARPQSSSQGNQVATITTSLLNVRGEARIANNVLTRVGRGQQFPVVELSADGLWVKLDLGNNTQGWVSAAYVTFSGASQVIQDDNLTGLNLRSNARLLVRQAASSDAAVIGLLLPNEIVPIRGRNRDITWWLIWDGTQLGWVNALYVTVSPDVNPVRVVIAGEED